jgi:hypothetical protein
VDGNHSHHNSNTQYIHNTIYIPHKLKAQGINRHRLARNHVIQHFLDRFHPARRVGNTVGVELFPFLSHRRFGLAAAKDEGPDAVGVAKADQSDTVNEVHAGVAALALLHDGGNGGKNNVLHILAPLIAVVVKEGNTGMVAVAVTDVLVGRFLFLFRHRRGQVIGKEIEKQLAVTVRIDVPAGQKLRQFFRIGQIAVVREADTVGVVRVQGLRFGAASGPGRGIAAVADAHVAAEFFHVVLLEHVLDETVVLAQVQAAAFGRDNAGGVLTAVLQDREAVKEHLIDLVMIIDIVKEVM